MPPLTRLSGEGVDLSSRIARTATVAASPAADAETIIATLTVSRDVTAFAGCKVDAFAAYLVGASGTAVQFRIRKTDVSGTVLKATGALNVTAADLRSVALVAFDTAPTLPGQVYVLTMIVTAGAAASTVSAVELQALIL